MFLTLFSTLIKGSSLYSSVVSLHAQAQCVPGEGKVAEAENPKSPIPQGEDECRGERAGSTQGVQPGLDLGS